MVDAAEERGRIATTVSWSSRTWYSWAWRLCVSAASYVLFYWIYGALNYLLVTRPYYSPQQTTLQVPSLRRSWALRPFVARSWCSRRFRSS
jgi:hypothetical protein